MTEPQKPSLESILTEAQAFFQSFESLLMATVDDDGHPNVSYAPFLSDQQGGFYIYISELARHTQNLMAHPEASIMFIEDEGQAAHLFARKRMTYRCEARELVRGSPDFVEVMNQFERHQGSFMAMMRGLIDFHLFHLHSLDASYVRGFGEAFLLKGPDLGSIQHLDGAGHGRSGNK